MLGFHVFACKKLQHSYNNICTENTSLQTEISLHPKNLSNTSKQFVGNILQIICVVDHFVGLGFTGL